MSVPVMASLGNKWLDTDYVCYNIGMCSSPSFKAENFTEWSQNILADKPNAPLPIYNSTETFNVAHISDLHIDFDYVEGTNAYCDEQLCCHEANGPANSTETAAGYWGAYNNCDIPPRTLRAALEDMKNREFDFIVWTGDNPPHEIWNQSQEIQKSYIGYTADMMNEVYNNTGIPIYPTLGNHGCFPVNVIDFDNDEWLTSFMAEKWAYFLPEEQQEQIKNWGGAYSILNEKHNIRVISLNTNACNNQNWFFFRNVTDQGGQIQFMEQELKKAEAEGSKVYFIGHIATCLGSCLDAWSKHYMTLVERYAHIVVGQFFGHTHDDVTCVTRALDSDIPIGMQYMPGSVTTYTNENPSYRVYQVEKDSKIVYDWTEYRLNLTKYNDNPELTPVWDVAYTFKNEYNVTDMLPETMGKWVTETLMHDEAAAVKLLFNKGTGGPAVPSTCDANCRKSLACSMNYGVAEDQRKCDGSTLSWSDTLIQELFGEWTYKENL